MVEPTEDMSQVKHVNMLSKFRGSVIGAVLGDCLGANFEFKYAKGETVIKFFEELPANKRKNVHGYTDDTAMARNVASSLIQNKGLNATHMAQEFVQEYDKLEGRGYGGNVGNVFRLLKQEGYKDVFGPSRAQFNGSGSYGNGAAMRIGPAAVYGYKKSTEQLQDLVHDISLITHSHKDALHGAMLQSAAVQLALQQESGPESVLNTQAFLSKLIEQMEALEGIKTGSEKSEAGKSYCSKLRKIENYLQQETEVSTDEINESLGTDVSALDSVPTALYSFLRCNRPVPYIKTDNPFARTLIFATSLGGDTDTISSMACAIAGAYYGKEGLPQYWLEICEGVEDAKTYADQLFELVNEQ